MEAINPAARRLCKTWRCRNPHTGATGFPGQTEVVRLCPPCLVARFGSSDRWDVTAALLDVPPIRSNREAMRIIQGKDWKILT